MSILTYLEFHLYYTLPVLAALCWLLKPFHSQQDNLKYKFLMLMAASTASIWDNYIVYHRAWWYCPTCVVAVIGYVPLEEYMFFIIMTLMTVAFSNFVMRWHLHTFFIRPNTSWKQTLLVRLVPVSALLAITYHAWHLTLPNKSSFYGSCILWYACPVLAILWLGAGEYILRRPVAVLLSIVIPSVYLCWADIVAISAGTWHISLRTSTGKMVVPDLPVEECLFFTLINTVLVFATCAIDRAQAILHLYKSSVQNQNPKQAISLFQHVKELAWAFCLPDQMLNNELFDDLTISWDILRKASKSFYTASAVFPSYVRQDLGVLYAFCRATDDLCDDESKSVQERRDQLDLTRQFVRDLFSQKTSAPIVIDWELYQNQLPASCISAFRAFTRLRHVLEVDPVEELLDGYKWDLERRPILDEQDLEAYSACVASSVGEMCTRVILAQDQKENDAWIIDRAREMGLVLQYVNIARDIVTDSETLGRCYLPQQWLRKEETEQIQQGNARSLGDQRLLGLSLKLVGKADAIMVRAKKGIDKLPANCQGGVRAACQVYAAIGSVLKQQKTTYPTRAHLKGSERAKIALLSVYNLYQSEDKPVALRQARKIKSFFVD
nr:lycopene cyclase / phytoene synthase [Blakeslea trispora]